MQLLSKYDGTTIPVYLHSQVTFTWKFTGDLGIVECGTMRSDVLALDKKLLFITKNRLIAFNVTLYTGRVSGSWDGKSPGQITFTLTSIKEVDNRIFLCQFKPTTILFKTKYDRMKLIVRGKSLT